jgi:hypothetical protein
MGSAPRITYTPRLDTTPEREVAALASVYQFILDAAAKKKAVGVTGTDDDMREESRSDSHANSITPK